MLLLQLAHRKAAEVSSFLLSHFFGEENKPQQIEFMLFPRSGPISIKIRKGKSRNSLKWMSNDFTYMLEIR
jgi:hypothetical protein